MFSQCANPGCAAPFSHREGQLLRFVTPVRESDRSTQTVPVVQHAWLCRSCSEIYMLEFREGQGVVMLPSSLSLLGVPSLCGATTS